MSDYKSTLREALEAEMLADIGKLHDQVQALKNTLPGILQQVSFGLNEINARAKLSESVVQRQFEQYVKNQIISIRGSTDQVKRVVLHQLSSDVLAAVNEGWASAGRQGDKLFTDAADQFSKALLSAVEVAERRATATMKNLCMDLKKNIDALNLRQTKNTRVVALMASVATGFFIGTALTLLLG